MSDLVKKAIESGDASALRTIADTAGESQRLMLQLLADFIEAQPDRPHPGNRHVA